MASNLHPTCGVRRPSSDEMEQLILYAMIAVIGVIPVILVLAHGGVFGPEPTVGLLMLAAAIAGLLAMWRLARKRRVR